MYSFEKKKSKIDVKFFQLVSGTLFIQTLIANLLNCEQLAVPSASGLRLCKL